MRKVLFGAVVAVVGLIGISEVYKAGYNNGVNDCRKTLSFAIDVAKAVTKEAEES